MIKTPADVVRPHDFGELTRAILSDRRLFLRTDQQAGFQQLLSWAAIERLVTGEMLLDGSLRVARKGMDLPLNMLMGPDSKRSGAWDIRRDKFQYLRHQGLSLVINDIGKFIPEIGVMNAMLERRLRTPIHTNCYVSFSRDSAFDAHWDDHNVLIMHLYGKKRWWCHGGPYRSPVRSAAFPMPSPLPAAEWEGILEPGDLLYVPRGDIHRAEVVGNDSVHLTVTIVPPRGADVLRWLAIRGESREVIRQDIQPIDTAEALAAYAADLKTELHRLVDELDLSTFLTDQDSERAGVLPLNFGLDLGLAGATFVRPALKREPSDKILAPLNEMERAVLLRTLHAQALSVQELIEAFGDPASVEGAITALSQRGLVVLAGG